MKLNYSFFILLVIISGCSKPENNASWQKLFNGKDLKDWTVKIKGYDAGDNFGNTFRVEDGILKVSYEKYDTFNDRFGHLFYNTKFSNYLLKMEYRFVGEQVAGGPGWAIRNSGAMLHSQDVNTMEKDQDFPISLEAQLLGGDGEHERTTLNLCTPGTNVVMNGNLITEHCIVSTSKTYHGDQWVTAYALVLGDSVVEHIIDGQVVLRYEKPQLGGEEALSDSTTTVEDKLIREGFIALQSESHPIEFRNVELLDLTGYRKDPEGLSKIIKKELGELKR